MKDGRKRGKRGRGKRLREESEGDEKGKKQGEEMV